MATTLNYLDSYCERAGLPGLMAEPVNAITNLFFIAAALSCIYLIIRLPPAKWRNNWDLWLLALFLFAIGVGSGLWHTIPTRATVLMDVIPITLFINLYLIAAMRRLLQFSWVKTGVCWLAYAAVTVAAQMHLPPDMLNGTVMYLPTYAALVVLTGAVALKNRYLGEVFFSMLMVWSLSLVFRTYDNAACELFERGTHFLWHSLNALVLYRLLAALIKHRVSIEPPIA